MTFFIRIFFFSFCQGWMCNEIPSNIGQEHFAAIAAKELRVLVASGRIPVFVNREGNGKKVGRDAIHFLLSSVSGSK
jgi:hypothetical protein